MHLEEDTGCGFDFAWCEEAGFAFNMVPANAEELPSVRLTGMGPKLLLSNVTTAEQPVLRWRLRVRGNTAVEFGCIPAHLPLSHTALHKCQAVPSSPNDRCTGFCSQITAGSLLPMKVPVMRGSVLDIVARRGSLEVLLLYPPSAKEITWQNGQPVQRPYHGPSRLHFEEEFSDAYDVRLAVTSWAKAAFDVLHVGCDRPPAAVALPAAEAAINSVPLEMLGDKLALQPEPLAVGGGGLLLSAEGGGNCASSMPDHAGLPAMSSLLPPLPPLPSSLPSSPGDLASLDLPEFAADLSRGDSASSLSLFSSVSLSLPAAPNPVLRYSDSRCTMCMDGQVEDCVQEH